MTEKRVCFDFEIDFSNGGGLSGHGFRLDIDGDDVSDDELAVSIIRDMRLLMVGRTRILNRRIIEEPHKRRRAPGPATSPGISRIVDLGRPSSCGTDNGAAHAGPRTRVTVPPRNPEAGGDDEATALDRLAALSGLVVRLPGHDDPAIDWMALAAHEVGERAVLIETGWSDDRGTLGHGPAMPYLTVRATEYLRDEGAALVGMDAPVTGVEAHGAGKALAILLEAGIPVVEGLSGLSALPVEGFRFFAVPPAVGGVGPGDVRAFAWLTGAAP